MRSSTKNQGHSERALECGVHLGRLAIGWPRSGCAYRRADPSTPAARIALACECHRHPGFGAQAERQTKSGSAVIGQGRRHGSWRAARAALRQDRRTRRWCFEIQIHSHCSPADARAIPRWGLTLNPQSAEWRRGHRADPRRSCAARELRGATCTAVLARRHKQVCERRQERTAHASRKHRSDTATTK